MILLEEIDPCYVKILEVSVSTRNFLDPLVLKVAKLKIMENSSLISFTYFGGCDIVLKLQ